MGFDEGIVDCYSERRVFRRRRIENDRRKDDDSLRAERSGDGDETFTAGSH